MEPFTLPDPHQKIDEAKIDHPEIWNVYENEEDYIRKDILAKLGLCVNQVQKINFLNNEISRANGQFQNSTLAPIFKAYISGEINTLLPRSQNIVSMLLTQNYHYPLAQKYKPIADLFMKKVNEEIVKDEMDIASLKKMFDEIIELTPDEGKSILLPLTKEINLFYEADKDVSDVTYASNLFMAYFQFERIRWLEDLINSLDNSFFKDKEEEMEINATDFIPIEGNLSRIQINKAFDFLCEVTVNGGKTLLSKENVVILKTIGFCLPKENSFKFDKIYITKFGGNKSKLYCFFGRLWDAHTLGLNKDLVHYAKFIQTYFNGFSPNLSTIQKGISGSKDKINSSKFKGYIPLRTEI